MHHMRCHKKVSYVVLVSAFLFFSSIQVQGETCKVLDWLKMSGLNADMIENLEAKVKNEPYANNWLMEKDGQIVSLVYIPWRRNQPNSHIMQQERSIAQMKASNQLLMYAVSDYYHQFGLTDKEGLATALYRVSSDSEFSGKILAGAQSSSSVLCSGVVALIWTREENISVIRQNLPAVDMVEFAYCQAVYANGRTRHDLAKYEQALITYLELYQLNCKIPEIYLDSAKVFLKTNKPDDAQRLLRYTLNNLRDMMSSDKLEELGDLFIQVNEDQSAVEAYKLALEKYYAEQNIN
jgi:hypothetical protein